MLSYSLSYYRGGPGIGAEAPYMEAEPGNEVKNRGRAEHLAAGTMLARPRSSTVAQEICDLEHVTPSF